MVSRLNDSYSTFILLWEFQSLNTARRCERAQCIVDCTIEAYGSICFFLESHEGYLIDTRNTILQVIDIIP